MGVVFKAKCRRQRHGTVTIIFALATLGATTEVGSFLFYVALPKAAKARTVVTVVCHCH
jgi:hypothetical protein